MGSDGSVLRAGVVGAGSGGMLSIRALEASPRFELKAVADVRSDVLERVGKEFPECSLWPDAKSMLQGAELDVVCVSTFATSHAEVVELGIASGIKGFLLEKPLTDKWSTAREILSQLESKGLPVVVPHGLLVQAGTEELLRRIHAGEIGAVELVEIQCTGWDLMNAGIHWMDFAVAALGDDQAQWVQCACDTTTETFRDGLEVETEAVTFVGTASGARIVMQTGDTVRISRPDKGLLFRLVGAEGVAEFWGWEDRFSLRRFDGRGSGLVEVPSHPRKGHQIYLERLADMLASSKADYTLPEVSLRALEICEAAYVSNRDRSVVRFPLASYSPAVSNDWAPGAAYRGVGGRDGRRL